MVALYGLMRRESFSFSWPLAKDRTIPQLTKNDLIPYPSAKSFGKEVVFYMSHIISAF
jgi:hypothetical protein